MYRARHRINPTRRSRPRRVRQRPTSPSNRPLPRPNIALRRPACPNRCAIRCRWLSFHAKEATMQRFFPALVGLVIVLAVLSSCVLVVRERDAALVFALGEVRETIVDPGLYFKLPPHFNNVLFLDTRLQHIETKKPQRIQKSTER